MGLAVVCGAAVAASASCWKNAPSVACPKTMKFANETCELDPPDQTFTYANQCGTGSGVVDSAPQKYCTYACSSSRPHGYTLTVENGGTTCQLPTCGGSGT